MSVSRPLPALSEAQSFEAEQYHRLRQQIERLSATRLMQVVAVTSAVAGEGKTVTALNLARSLAGKEGRNVLLIDADLRRPAVMPTLGLAAPDKGLATALRAANGSLGSYVHPVDGTSLAVLPGETVTDGGSYELLTSPKLTQLLEEARKTYDYVIVDTPPVLPLPDSSLLRDVVDGYLFVVSALSTPRQLFTEALNALEPASVIGLVYNRDDRPVFGFYRSHYREYFRAYVKSYRRTAAV